MIVIKRDGSEEPFNPSKIQKRILDRCEGLKVNGDEVAIKTIAGFADGMTTVELDNLAAEIAATMTMNHPDYSYLASRIAISRLHKETENSLLLATTYLDVETDLLNERYLNLIEANHESYDAMIVHDRDYNFDYFGYKTLERAYLLRANDRVVERPQYLWMRVAVAIWEDNLEMVKKTYDDLSMGLYIHATPTLFNAGTKHQQLSSCFLIANKGDDKVALMDTLKDVSVISSYAGGIGLHVHDVRAEGSLIAGSGGKSNGLRPMLKTYNEASKWWDQGGGKRKGSFAIYLEPWHKDIQFFLEMRNNHGKEELRARDLFNALWTPDLFMERVEAYGKWTLFCPNEVLKYNGTKLQELVGNDFKKAYEELEAAGIGVEIKAQDLWLAILKAQMETGTPYMGYKDAVNTKSNQKNLGVIKSSNLCIEINEYSSADEQAVCNLGSLALPKFITNKHFSIEYGITSEGSRIPIGQNTIKEFNHEALYEAAYQLTLNLNRVIDINFYPTIETKNSNMRHRPIGIGVQGLADVFAIMKLPFDSEEALVLNNEIFETIYYAFLNASMDLAIEQEPYESFKGSPASEGILQFDLWGITPSERYKWRSLKEGIKKFGLRNSLGIALMPTASTSQILGNNECFEPYNSNLSTRGTLAGTFVVINKYLVKELESLGLWNPAMKNKLVVANGSVQTIAEIPSDIKAIYKTAYEIKQKVILDMAAGRGAYVDQAQSMNIFMEGVTIGKLSSMHFYGWKKGLKTGMYYLRQKAAADAIKFTAEKVDDSAALACSIDNPENCEMCGS